MKSKYSNIKTIIDNIKFDSKKEAGRYLELKLLLRDGKIKNLEIQKRFDIIINNKFICFYKADFTYEENNMKIVEDVKGFRTIIYRLKKKLIEAIYDFKIIEI